ncbi:MAG TPA: hypothetical protein VJP76_02735 [Candidatus Tumulicola sp.]|nr:hypothetical protein [Candidatus Tumulicola sp.]
MACVGDDYGAVQCFKVDPASGALKRISFLRLSQRTSGARAYGIAFDWSGNLYVSDFIKYVGSSTVDEYSASRVARCSNGCNPSRSLTLINFGQVYFLASDGRSIYANGYDATLKSVIVCKIALATGNCSGGPVFAFGAQAFFPGGMSFDGRHDIVINNQMAGTLIQFDAPFSPNEPVSSLFKYQSSQTPDYTAIALDRSQKNVWGANYWTCGSVTCTNAQSNTYPLGGYGALGATQTVQFVAGAWFLGVALSPAPRT